MNPPVWWDITYLHIFEIFNLFIPFSIGVDSSFVFCGTPCRLVWFVFVGIGGHLGSSRWQRLGFRHMALRRMHVMPNSVFFNTSSCKDPCFKGCISRCAVKSSGVWEATHPFTSGLSPGVMLNGVFYNTSSCTHWTVCLWLPGVMSGHRCNEVYMVWTIMFIVDVLSHDQIYGEDVILMGVKYATYL